ncbi:MAG: phosphatase PAP2 family protein [Proteobacteria bacterium]|nr:MAG: phosphatase PAP2 family protein [Pseudomonadota bacterium]
MKLPLLIRDRLTKWMYFVLGTAATIIIYSFTNRVHYFEPRYLQFDAIDRMMPFWPWTIWIYLTEFIIFICAYFALRSKELQSRYFYAYMTLLVLSAIVFVLYPVTFPRADYPTYSANFNEKGMEFLRTYMDSPANCLPSLHVSTSLISALAFWKESRWKAWVFMIWAIAISITTMTTKQHYFIDVWTATILTFVVFWFFTYKVKIVGSANDAGANR